MVPFSGDVPEFPDLYDLLFGDKRDDLSLYLAESQPGKEVLELGVGSGRVAIPMAEMARQIVGLDSSAAMIRSLIRKRNQRNIPPADLRIVIADMSQFCLKARFGLILSPFMTFNYLMTPEAQLRHLECVARHLDRTGVLIYELMTLATVPEIVGSDGMLRRLKVLEDSDTGRTTEVWRTAWMDWTASTVCQDRYFREFEGGLLVNERKVRWRNRLVSVSEFELLAGRAGLRVESASGGYGGERLDSSSPIALFRLTHLD